MSCNDHCRNCFLSSCTQISDCPLVVCQSKCGMLMHNCKRSDHRNVCQNEHVACINSNYGCSAKILRSRLSSHLKKCPANVILCTMEWGRYPVYSEDRLKYVPFFQPNPALVKGYLDVELAVRDQKIIDEQRIKKYKRGLSKRLSERFDLKQKLSYERAKVIQQEIQNKRGTSSGVGDNMALTPAKPLQNTTEFYEEIVEERNPKEVEQNNVVTVLNVPECPKIPGHYVGLGVNINLETIPRFLKHKFMYRVPCSQLLRRHEFAAHFKNVHSDIQGGLGWIEQRCPLAQYGCSFVRNRLCPFSQDGSVVFSQEQGTFGVKPIKDRQNFPQFNYLLWLPRELLEVICKWLDSFSLRNLELTCKGLYEILHQILLSKRGIVVLKWKKRRYEDGSTSWTIGNKCWSFTSAFSEVHQWVHSETPIMSSHLENCPYFQQHRPENPFPILPIGNVS